MKKLVITAVLPFRAGEIVMGTAQAVYGLSLQPGDLMVVLDVYIK